MAWRHEWLLEVDTRVKTRAVGRKMAAKRRVRRRREAGGGDIESLKNDIVESARLINKKKIDLG